MRLKKLILHGFKSFADRTEFAFDSPITGVVGPNGCGKSNVVDGFKWVLGEQSAKSLRGEAMMDVIFNGSGSRKPAGMAEVVLVFDNPKREDETRALNLELDEVAVGRRLYRDGTSEYHLNNTVSRLKDIRELFMDTGVGVDAYSVIEQGRVAALLEANPEERRLIFEEAAGISKFKQRKKEAQRKLEKVDQNLLRVHDIVEEVEKRLRSVKVQAGRARTYQEHSTRLGELRLGYALQDYHAQRTALDDLETRRDDAKFRLDDASGDFNRRTAELAEKRERFDALSKQRQQLEYELVQTRAGVQSARQREQYAQQQLRQNAEQLDSLTADHERTAQKLAEVSEFLERETLALAELTAELNQRRQEIERRQQEYKESQLQSNSLNQQIEQHKAAILDLMRRLATLNSRINAIGIERKNLAAQQERLSQRQTVVGGEVEALETQRAELQSRLDETAAHLAEQQRLFDERKSDALNLGKRIAVMSENLGAAREHRSGLLSRQKLLSDLEAKREGVSEGVKSVLRQREKGFTFIRGLVADVLRVDVEHAHVIEAALDGRDQWLITDDCRAAVAAEELLADLEGRVNVACTDRLAALGSAVDVGFDDYDWNRHRQGVRLAADLVRVEPGRADAALARRLLGKTIVVDDLPAAVALHREGPVGWRYVTHVGEVIESDGTFRAGPLTAAMGLISRRSELEAIAQQIADVDGRIEALARDLTAGNAAARELETVQNGLRNEVYKANTARVDLTSKLAQNRDKQASLRREAPMLERELSGLANQLEKLAAEETGLLEKRTGVESEQVDRQRQVEERTESQRTLAETLRRMNEELTAARVEVGQTQQKQLAAQQQLHRQTATRAELSQQAERLARSIEGVAGKQPEIEAEADAAKTSQTSLTARQEALALQTGELAEQATAAHEAVKELSTGAEGLRKGHAELEQRLHSLELKHGEVRVRLETLVQRTLDELQLDLPARYDSLFAPRPDGSAGLGYEPANVDWEKVAGEIRELREKIQRLGNVNLDSLGELEELEQRESFLTTQVTDLTESKRQLEHLIDTINAESGLRFEQTFTAVREHFQGMFRKLFGGGKADIYLETEIDDPRAKPIQTADGQFVLPEKKRIDPLEAGIEIMAHPPGKKPATISQLSGGEKAMTCIALLMSIFKSKPSPFCLLDEVDAPLDEANNQRFGLIIQEFLAISQFIVITHHKRTMQICDVLYGVTMQEQGVSKRVAVKFDQVDSEGRVKESVNESAAA